MTKMLLRYVHEFKDRHGRTRRYVRRRRFKQVPLPRDPGSAEFMDAYRQALDPKTAPRQEIGAERTMPGSIADLVARYYRSPEFVGLKGSTRSTYRSIIEPFRKAHGDKRVAVLKREHVKDMLAKKAATPTAGNNWLKRMRQLMVFAIDIGMRTDDPTSASSHYASRHPVIPHGRPTISQPSAGATFLAPGRAWRWRWRCAPCSGAATWCAWDANIYRAGCWSFGR
jgi:hypothetical protein